MKNKRDLFATMGISFFFMGIIFSIGLQRDSVFYSWGTVICFSVAFLIAASVLSVGFTSKFLGRRWLKNLVLGEAFIMSIGMLLLLSSWVLIPALGTIFGRSSGPIYSSVTIWLTMLGGGSIGITMAAGGAIIMITDYIKKRRQKVLKVG